MTVTFMKKAEDGTLMIKEVMSPYSAKVYPLVCDRLTLTCGVPETLKPHIVKCFKQEGAKPYSGYQLSGKIKDVGMKLSPYLPDDEDKITSAFIQCAPYDSNIGFVRLDFNPATVDLVDLKGLVNNNWLTHPQYGFNYLLEHGRVTRIDLAVDVASELTDALYFYYKKMQRVEVIRTFKGDTEYVESRTEYLGGKIKAAKRIVIYDRIPSIKFQNQKKYYDQQLQVPVPEDDIMRVEVRLYPKIKKTLKYYMELDNQFAPLTISSPQFDKYDEQEWKLFIPLARFEGAQATLGRLPKPKKKLYIERLNKGKVNWWRPDFVWEQLPGVVNEILSV